MWRYGALFVNQQLKYLSPNLSGFCLGWKLRVTSCSKRHEDVVLGHQWIPVPGFETHMGLYNCNLHRYIHQWMWMLAPYCPQKRVDLFLGLWCFFQAVVRQYQVCSLLKNFMSRIQREWIPTTNRWFWRESLHAHGVLSRRQGLAWPFVEKKK